MIWIVLLTSQISGVWSLCSSLLYNPAGVANLDISHDPLEELEIITIEGILNVDNAPPSRVKPHYERLKFFVDGDPADVTILEINTEINRMEQCMFLSGTFLKDSEKFTLPQRSDRKFINGFDLSGHMKISRDKYFKFQIISMSPDGYDIYLNSFDNTDSPFFFNYGSPENWKMFDDRRLEQGTKIVSECDSNCHLAYTSISTCSYTDIKLQDNLTVEVLRVEVGKTYTLSCSASGAPYLTSEWRDKEDRIIPGHTEVSSMDGGFFNITSSLVIPDFDVADIGNYTCAISNKNMGNSVEKIVSLNYVYLEAAPQARYSLLAGEIVQLLWTVKGHPLRGIQLECISELGSRVHFERVFQKSPSLVNFSREISTGNVNFSVLSCILLDEGEFLKQKIIRFDEKDSEIEPERAVEGKEFCSLTSCAVVVLVLLIISLSINAAAFVHNFVEIKHRFTNVITYCKNVFRKLMNALRNSFGYNPVPQPEVEENLSENGASFADNMCLQQKPTNSVPLQPHSADNMCLQQRPTNSVPWQSHSAPYDIECYREKKE